jgi:hypothetical protein
VPFEVTVSNWETLSTDNQRMTGRYALSFRAAALQGSARIDAELRIVAKVRPESSARRASAHL